MQDKEMIQTAQKQKDSSHKNDMRMNRLSLELRKNLLRRKAQIIKSGAGNDIQK